MPVRARPTDPGDGTRRRLKRKELHVAGESGIEGRGAWPPPTGTGADGEHDDAQARDGLVPASLPRQTLPGFWRLAATAALPPGGYTVLPFATLPGALADGRFDPPDLIAVAETSFPVQP